jgi:hypothetical protein
MLTSISPLGERARGNRWGRTVTAYVAGSAFGGATTGAVLGLLGSPLSATPAVLASAAAACGLAAVADLTHRLPSMRRQVDQEWLTRYRGWVYGLGYGYQLGLGVVTIVTSASTYAVLALCLLSGSMASGAVIGCCFGVVRALPLLQLRRADSPARLRAAAARLEDLSAVAGRATTAVLALAAAAFTAAAVAA